MKIIQIFNRYLSFGGEENSVNRIATHLEMSGAEVVRFIRSSDEWQHEKAPSKLEQAKRVLYHHEVLLQLEELHHRFKPDIWLLHNILPVVSVGVYGLAKKLDVKVVQWLHNYRPISLSGSLRLSHRQLTTTSPFIHLREVIDGAWRGRASSFLLAIAYWRARQYGWFDHVHKWVAVSEVMKQHFERANFYPQKLACCRHSWDINPASNHKRSNKTFLYMGRLLEEKGVLFLIEIFKHPALKEVELIIAGSGALDEEISLSCKELPNISYVGWVSGDEKKKLIRKASAVLFPSLWEEPLSTIAYESFEQERPVISSDRGGMTEIVLDGINGKVLPAQNDQVWINTILEFVNKPTYSKNLGRSARLWLEENIHYSSWYKEFLNAVN